MQRFNQDMNRLYRLLNAKKKKINFSKGKWDPLGFRHEK